MRRAALSWGLLLCWQAGMAAPPGAWQVQLDARVELETVVSLLSTSPAAQGGLHWPESEYRREIQRRFKAFRSHPVVRLYAQPALEAFGAGARMQVLLRLSEPPGLEEAFPALTLWMGALGGRRSMNRWLEGLRDFSRESRFLEFFEAQRPGLEAGVASFRRRLEALEPVRKIEDYTGLAFSGRYRILLSPLHGQGAVYSSLSQADDGSHEIASVVGPARWGPAPEFYAETIPGALWHELAHALMDTLAELFPEEISALERPRELREHVAEAVALRLVESELGSSALWLQLEKSSEGASFEVLGSLTAALRRYEASRGRFPNLAAFYPELLRAFPRGTAGNPGAPPPESWIALQAGAFPSAAQRGRALRSIDLILAAAEEPGLRLRRGWLNYLQADYGAALSDARGLLGRDPDNPGALLLEGLSLRYSGRPEASRRAFDRLEGLCREPRAAVPGPICRQAGFARPAGPGALASAPASAEPPWPAGEATQRDRAVGEYVRGRVGQALERLAAVLAHDPEDIDARLDYAVVLHGLGRLEEALAQYDQVVAQAQASPQPSLREVAANALSGRASLSLGLGQKERARGDWRRALDLAPGTWAQRPQIEEEIRGLALPHP